MRMNEKASDPVSVPPRSKEWEVEYIAVVVYPASLMECVEKDYRGMTSVV